MNIDEIRIKSDSGVISKTLPEWDATPFPERVALIADDRVEFFSGNKTVSPKEAIRAIREAKKGKA